jgi:hypothetical protein
MNAYADSPRTYVRFVHKNCSRSFLLDLACVCVLFRHVLFEINRAIMRLARRQQSFIKKRTAKENAIKERMAREPWAPNWRTVKANNKYRADNLAAIAN